MSLGAGRAAGVGLAIRCILGLVSFVCVYQSVIIQFFSCTTFFPKFTSWLFHCVLGCLLRLCCCLHLRRFDHCWRTQRFNEPRAKNTIGYCMINTVAGRIGHRLWIPCMCGCGRHYKRFLYMLVVLCVALTSFLNSNVFHTYVFEFELLFLFAFLFLCFGLCYFCNKKKNLKCAVE